MARTKFPWQKGKQNSEYELENTFMENMASGRRPAEKPLAKQELAPDINPSLMPRHKRPQKPNTKYIPNPYDVSPNDFFERQRPPSRTGRRGRNKA